MPQNAETSQSRIIPAVITGFVLILIAVSVSWLISTHQMNNLSQVIETSRIIARKMDIVASMTEMARTRARLTMQMVYTDDLFERDDINMTLSTKATEFAQLRQQLIGLGLNQQELKILDQQGEYIAKALTKQREAADLAISMEESDRELAAQIVIHEVYPDQNMIVDYFMTLLELQKAELDVIAEQSVNSLDRFKQFNLAAVALIFVAVIAVVIFMLSSIRRIENQLVHEKEKAQVTLRSIADGVITVNKTGEIDYLNQVALDYLEHIESQLVGCRIDSIFSKQAEPEEQKICDVIKRLLDGQGVIKEVNDVHFRLMNDSQRILSGNISPIVDIHHQVSGVVISFSDITKSHELLQKIKHQAAHDSLTGLYNRRAFEEKVKQMLDLYEGDVNHAFCIIDLDQFKIVNDSAGHGAGDELLRQLATVMKPVVRKTDLLARLGGDEFGAFLSDVTPNEAISIAEKMLEAIQSFGFYWQDNIFRVGASIGIVSVPAEVVDYEYLFRAADQACYVAKNEGRNRIHLMPLNAELLFKKVEESERLQYLTQTLENGQFHLYGQSIEPLSQRVEGRKHMEVLLRMKDKDDKVIAPMAFIPMAERYGLMADIDSWVLKQVCQHILQTPADDTIYAVNLSGQTLSSRDRMNDMVVTITEQQVPAGRLCLEVTETVAIANLEIASKYMSALREYGCYIALDDFGSGLSSFSYLSTLPLDYIKIDGVFVTSMMRDEASTVMVEAIHKIADKMGLFTIAEFVEDQDAVDCLKSIGIDMAQGFFFDNPSELISPK